MTNLKSEQQGAIFNTAFKEWAVICRALTTGRQDVILRKGGIVEPGGRFQVLTDDFYLFPTFVHQSKDHLIPSHRIHSLQLMRIEFGNRRPRQDSRYRVIHN